MKFTLIIVLLTSLHLNLYAQEHKKFNPHSSNAFHFEMGVGLGGKGNMLGGGWSLEPQFKTNDNILVGFYVGNHSFSRFFENGSWDGKAHSVVSMMPSIQFHPNFKGIVPFIGFRGGLKATSSPYRTHYLATAINFGVYLWMLKLEYERSFYDHLDGSTFIHLKLRF